MGSRFLWTVVPYLHHLEILAHVGKEKKIRMM